MKRLLALILALLLLTGCGAKTTKTAPVAEEPAVSDNPFGAFSAETLQGETLTEAVFAEADLTVVNLWATFCGPCIREMPILGMLHEELENVQFLGIVMDCNDKTGGVNPDQVALAAYITELTGANYPCLLLNESLAMLGMTNYQTVPITLFVDKNGNIVGSEITRAMDEASWRETIAERLEMAG